MDYVKVLEAVPKIIEAAAKSVLGIFALMLIALTVIMLVFFKRAPVGVRLVIALVLVIGVGVFALSVGQTQQRQSVATAYIRATAAFDQGMFSAGIEQLNAALASLSDEGNKLTVSETDGWRYYLLTQRSLWKAFAEDETKPDVKERTGKHLRDAYTYWLRIPDGALPNKYITEARLNNLARYLCVQPDIQKFVRAEDVSLRDSACRKQGSAAGPILLLTRNHLAPPPAVTPPTDALKETYERATGTWRKEKEDRQYEHKEERYEPLRERHERDDGNKTKGEK